jgi:hypothetical protein
LIKLIAIFSQFNFTGIKFLNRYISVKSSLYERDIIESFHIGIEGAINGIATVIPDAVNRI